MSLGLKTTVLQFETIKEIGHDGKNSSVYLANDLQLDGVIVIKRIPKNALAHAGDFYKEARVLYNSEHQNVVKVNYGCEDSNYVYMAMPFYKNGSLKNLISKRFLTTREVIRYSIQFLSGLHHIHSRKLVHFDIKPDNIFLTDSDAAVLADFGLAKALDIYGVAEQKFLYKKQVPPEALTGYDKTILFDIYLAGLTIYRLCNGNQVFYDQYNQLNAPGGDYYKNAILAGQFPDRSVYLPHIPKSLRKVVNKAISVDPNDRYPNALALINALSSVDTLLEWQYFPAGNKQVWQLDKIDKIIRITVTPNGADYSVESTKYMKTSMKTTTIHAHTDAKVVSNKINAYLYKAFTELE